jgi:hypothetical protein
MTWAARVCFLAVARDFSPLHIVQSCSGAHPASYPMSTVSISPSAWGVKLTLTFIQCQGQEWWSYTSGLPYVFVTVINYLSTVTALPLSFYHHRAHHAFFAVRMFTKPGMQARKSWCLLSCNLVRLGNRGEDDVRKMSILNF